MEEQEVVREVFVGRHHFSLTLPLDFEDVLDPPLLVPVSILDVVLDHFIFPSILVQRFNQYVQCLVDIVHGVHLYLFIQCSQQNLRSELNVSKALKIVVLLLDLVVVPQRRSNGIGIPREGNYLIVPAREL